MKDVTLGGTEIPAMSQLCVLFASANDDEAKFPDGRTLDTNRPNVGNNLTFCAGTHRCIGAALARMEVKVAAQEIIRRLDNIQLAVAPEESSYLPTLATHTIAQLPLRFERRKV